MREADVREMRRLGRVAYNNGNLDCALVLWKLSNKWEMELSNLKCDLQVVVTR